MENTSNQNNDKNNHKNNDKNNDKNKAGKDGEQRAKRQQLIIALVVCGLIVTSSWFAGNYFVFDEQEAQVVTKEKNLLEIKTNNNLLQQIADNRLELDKETNRIDEAYKALAPLIPEKKELPSILDKIQRAAIDRGLRLENFSPRLGVNKAGALSEIPISIELTGDDEQLRLYISSLNYLERILHVNSLKTTKIEQAKTEQGQRQGSQGNIKAELEVSAYISNIQNSELNKATK